MYYADVPKTQIENLQFRKFVLERAADDPRLQTTLIEVCRRDILFYFNLFLWTYDPRLPKKAIPFITYPYQDEGILAIQSAIRDQDVMVIEKSRDMGASWMCCGVFDYEAQFTMNSQFLMLSRVADLVDKRGEPNSLFWKIDFIHKNLPKWFLDNEKDVYRRILGCEYLKTGSIITGSTTTEASGIGGRATAAFVDEFSRFDPTDAAMVKSGLADVTGCRIFNFTPSPSMGKAHPSYSLVEQAQKGHIRSQRWHWRLHPEKAKGLYRVDKKIRSVEYLDPNFEYPPTYKFQLDGEFEFHSPWFDKERTKRGNDRDVREMVEIDYQGSSYTVFDVNIIDAYINEVCKVPKVEGDIIYDENTGNFISFASHKDGKIKLWTDLDGYGNPPKAEYAGGVDASFGKGSTNSVLSIANINTGKKILEYAIPNMYPDRFAIKCYAILTWLDFPWLYWEKQGPGDTFGDEIVKLNYPKIFIPVDTSKLGNKVSDRFGWMPTNNNKDTLLSVYRTALSTRDFENPSREALLETLEWVNGPKGYPVHNTSLRSASGKKGVPVDPSGASQNHGDRVIADALVWRVVKERGSPDGRKANDTKVLPGMLEYWLREDDRPVRDVLYPNWRR